MHLPITNLWEGIILRGHQVFILYLDANNLYGRAMQEYLPWKHFEWMSPHQLNYDFIKGLEPEGEVGCIIQCSLEYPVALHDYHSDYPLAPIKKLIPYGMLSPIAKMICDKHKLKRTTNVEKLLATVEDKDFYILHYRNLKLYVSLGLMSCSEEFQGISFFFIIMKYRN